RGGQPAQPRAARLVRRARRSGACRGGHLSHLSNCLRYSNNVFYTNSVLSSVRRSSQTVFETGTVFKVSTEPGTETGPAAGVAAVPPPPWQRMPARPARRRRDPISREAIVETAVRLLDAEGLDALSMRGIADELGTGAASLYWHVGSKDGLLDLVMDQVIGEQRVPDPEPGRGPEQLRELARKQREICLRHPWIVEVSIGRIPMGPNALNYSERVLAILKSGGVPDTLAVQGYLLMISTVNGFMLDEVGDAQPGAPSGVPQ